MLTCTAVSHTVIISIQNHDCDCSLQTQSRFYKKPEVEKQCSVQICPLSLLGTRHCSKRPITSPIMLSVKILRDPVLCEAQRIVCEACNIISSVHVGGGGGGSNGRALA